MQIKSKNIMKKLYKIIFFAFLIIIPARICISQVVTVNTDTSKISQQENNDSRSLKQDQGQNKTKAGQQGNNANTNTNTNTNANANANANGNQSVKQVKGARPDMSKARGARPPSVVRQSGSGVPKGIGKPGGAMKRGGR
jgi:hypothetical protein